MDTKKHNHKQTYKPLTVLTFTTRTCTFNLNHERYRRVWWSGHKSVNSLQRSHPTGTQSENHPRKFRNTCYQKCEHYDYSNMLLIIQLCLWWDNNMSYLTVLLSITKCNYLVCLLLIAFLSSLQTSLRQVPCLSW